MRDRRVRLGFVALILSFPPLIFGVAERGRAPRPEPPLPARPIARAAVGPEWPPAVWLAEGAIVAGLVFAGFSRERLRPQLRPVLVVRPRRAGGGRSGP